MWVIDKKMGQEILSIPRNSGYVIKRETITFSILIENILTIVLKQKITI